MKATLAARGASSANLNQQRLDDLFRLFARVCQEMPLFNGVVETPETISLPSLEPNVPADLRRAA